jgi:hypothetical protein
LEAFGFTQGVRLLLLFRGAWLSLGSLGGIALMNPKVKICEVVMVITFINLFAFIVVAVWLGGDAVNGGASGEHYYLAEHGHQVEVSHGVWIYSRLHSYSAMISAPLFITAGYIRDKLKKTEHDNAA